MKLPSQNSSTVEFSMPEEGIHKMKLLTYTEPELSQYKSAKGDDKYTITLTFQIDDDDSDSDGETITKRVGLSMHPQSTLYPIVKALMGGEEPEADEEVDLDDLVGSYIMGTITHVTKPSTKNPGTMATFANLTGAAPVRRKKKAQAEPQKPSKPAPKAQTDDDETWDDDETDAA